MAKHPLSDEVIRDYGWYHYNSDQLRAAYDKGMEDRLEQVVKWLRHNLGFTRTSVDYIVQNLQVAMHPATVEELTEAMLPTTTQENNS